MDNPNSDAWLFEISSKKKLVDLNFREIWRYRDLLLLFVKRDLVTAYKQTILGPLWYFIQPLFTSVVFTLIFNNIASIQTGLVPAFLFNLAGVTAWNYFKICFTGTYGTFKTNAALFSKVYFPRFILPMSKAISNLVKFGIQMLIFVVFYLYYVFYQGVDLVPTVYLLLFPAYLVLIIIYGLGLGMIISTLITKYRDLSILLTFAVQLLMYVSAVPYPMSELKVKAPEYSWLVDYNPIAHIIEGFRYSVFGTDNLIFSWPAFAVTSILGLGLFVLGLMLFNRTEKTFIDTV